ncbi:uncharacterized protein [Lepeophtheirus salmonis]|uniref:Fungal lipase-type domain-containing protein n=1 Tax=Lepeophtheirus salmonis TaxID=72036 RepID=A0A0K2TC32_LEPSM|nr:uncharacterized protein LOC121123952 isoform X2 [Lepeophtheirus salmonis]
MDGGVIMKRISSIKSIMKTKIIMSLTNKYPEIDTLMKIINIMVRKYHEECISAGIATDLDGDGLMDEMEEDDRWVPYLLTLGLIYKVQKNDSKAWYNHETSFLQNDDLQEKFLTTFGYFWHLLVEISKCIRTQSSEDVLEQLRTTMTCIPQEDIIYAHSTDQQHLGDHCPDFALTLQRDQKLVVLTICGTRMIPAPEMKDVFMDLYADTEPFLHGHAHRGMAIGCRNIVEKVLPFILSTLEENPGYEIMVTGYSLGAGISQLVTMEFSEGESRKVIPSGTIIRCFCYGTPPVFYSDEVQDYKCPNVYSVTFNNDGLISASLTNVLKLFMQIKALERMHMRRRDMCRLVFSKSDFNINPLESFRKSGGNEQEEEGDEDIQTNADEDDDEDEMGDTENELKSELWMQVREALDKVSHGGDLIHLEHPSKLFIFKRKNDIITRIFHDTNPFTCSLRLRASMFKDHMPWGYNTLFEGYGLSSDDVDLNCVK